jgi:hypothetical protein
MNFQQMIGAALSGIGGSVRTGHPEADRYARYMAKMLEQILTRWTTVGASGVLCHLAQQAEDGDRQCKSVAIGGCMACGSPVCIDHAFVSPRGALCYACVDEEIAKRNPDAKNDRGKPFGFVDPYANETEEDTRRRHLRTLRLADSADADDIKAAYKRLAKSYHPDRAPESERDAASKKLRGLNEAYEWLVRRKDKAA